MDRTQTFWFVVAIAIYFAASFGTAFVCGIFVERYGLKVNYSRKVGHFVTIGLPWALQQAFHLDGNMVVAVLGAVITPLNLVLYVKPIRSRVPVVARMFRSFDRPEDRPHTLRWLATQYAGVYLVYLGLYPALMARGVAAWMLIPIVVNVIGDGLAEPVGVSFGYHPYSCGALFTRKRYQRTMEGSAVVFLSALIAVWLCRPTFTDSQFALAIAVVPITSAVAEAISPHTWDAPFLFFAIGVELVLLSFV